MRCENEKECAATEERMRRGACVQADDERPMRDGDWLLQVMDMPMVLCVVSGMRRAVRMVLR